MPQSDLPAPPRHARNVERAVARYGDLGRAWVAGLWQGDEPADAVAADLAEVGRQQGRAHRRRLVDRAIAGDPDPAQPASLTALLDSLEVEPDWVDHDQLDRAGDHLARNSAQLGLTLAAASLMVGYTNPAAARPWCSPVGLSTTRVCATSRSATGCARSPRTAACAATGSASSGPCGCG